MPLPFWKKTREMCSQKEPWLGKSAAHILRSASSTNRLSIRQVRTYIQELRLSKTWDGTCQGYWNLGPGLWMQQLSSPSLSVLVMVVKCLKTTQLRALITCMFEFLSIGTQAEQRPSLASWEIGARDLITHSCLYSCYVLFTGRCDWCHGWRHLRDECGLLKLRSMGVCEKALWGGCWAPLCCDWWGWRHLNNLD